jgi:site-specific DNA recombinase
MFRNHELGRTPEDELRLQVQGMMAEYERATILERHRRGKRHAAHAGAVHVLVAAPYGYRDLPKHDGGGPARYEMLAEEARVVGQMFDGVGHERVTIGDVCRRLSRAGAPTRTGKAVWDRRAVGGRRRNPASRGTAAFGKTRAGPRRPRRRAQRGRPLQPRRASAPVDRPREEWMTIPVPAMVEPEVLTAVQEQLRDNQRHARQYRRGARYLLQGLVRCQGCGYAYDGKGISHNAAKGRPRDYAYYRCLGTDAYRFGGERVCHQTQVRTDLLDLAVWQEVRGLLAHPDRLAEEDRRRLHPHAHARTHELTTVEGQLNQLRQGLTRLLDSYAEGLMEKREFEPRIMQRRQRGTKLEEQAHQLADAAALHADLQLSIGRREDFAAQVQDGREEADWTSRRELIRALVKRVDVDHDQVNGVFRVDQRPGDLGSEKKSLQHCRRSTDSALG